MYVRHSLHRYVQIIILGFLLALFLIPGHVFADVENVPPKPTAFSLTPDIVNTTVEAQTISVTLALKDDFAGVGHISVYLAPEGGTTQRAVIYPRRVSGDDLNGIYKGTVNLPVGSKEGTWSVRWLYLSDKIGNYKFVNKSELESLFGPGSASFTNMATFADISAPKVTNFSMTPKLVNTESAGQQITITADLTDDFAGTRYGTVYLKPEAGTTQRLSFYLRKVSGDNLKGTYTGTATLPVGSQEGVWSVSWMYLTDKIGNYEFPRKNDIESLFGPGSASITNEAISDISAPKITSLSLTPKLVNTETQSQQLTLTADLTDDFAGVGYVTIYLTPENGATQRIWFCLRRVSGDALSGTYKGSATMPVGSQEGVWSVRWLYLSDKIGNYKFLYKSHLESLFGMGEASITNLATFSDITPPEFVIGDDTTPPSVDAGEDKTTNTLFTQDGSAHDEGSGIATYAWTKESGPGEITFGSANAEDTTISASADGSYVIRLTATDKAGNLSYDEMVLTWDTAPPEVDAGEDKTTNDLFTQDGSAHDEGSGIASYSWTKESGPGEITFGSANAEDTTISASADGSYVIRLTVTDKAGNSSYDEMVLTVPASESDPEPIPDLKAPQLTHFVLTPKVVSTEDSDQELNLMVHLTDDLEGVYAKGDQADPSYSGSTVMLRLRPEAGGDEKVDFILGRISGDDLKGAYRARPIMPKGSKVGVWRVEYLYLVDKIGNHQYLSADQIDALLPGKQGTTIINQEKPKGPEPDEEGPETHGKGYSAKTISKRKAPRYKNKYNAYKKKYRKTKNKRLKKRYKKAASKYLKYYRLARKGTAIAKVKFMAKDSTKHGKSNLLVKIQKKIISKARAKRQARYKKLYIKYRNLYRKTRNRTLKRRYKRAAAKYRKAYRRIKVVYYKNVKTIRAGWTDSGAWKKYKYKGKKGLYKFYVYATDVAGNKQRNIAKGAFKIR